MLKGLAPVTLSKTACYYQRNGLSLQDERLFLQKRLVRPHGLPVRSLRTVSPNPSDWEFALIGLNASFEF